MNAKPINPLASLLFSLAHALAPKADRLWIGDMRLEAAFVPNKLSFAFAALGLAFKFRFAALKLNRPVGIAFASFAVAAVATFLVVPNLFGSDGTTNAAMSGNPTASYESVQDIAEERGYSAAAQDELPAAAQEDVVADAAQDTPEPPVTASVPAPTDAEETAPEPQQAAAPQSESAAEVAPTDTNSSAASEAQAATEVDIPVPDLARASPETEEPALAQGIAEVAPPAAATLPAPAATPPAITPNEDSSVATGAAVEQGVAESLGLEPPTANGTLSIVTPEAEQAKTSAVPAPRTPDVDTQVISTLVRGQNVEIRVVTDALLTLYRDTNFSGSPRLNRYVTAGETFTANVPFSLYTNNAAAITITADGNSLVLGEENEEQFRIFSKP
jgi:hypothetical protein